MQEARCSGGLLHFGHYILCNIWLDQESQSQFSKTLIKSIGLQEQSEVPFIFHLLPQYLVIFVGLTEFVRSEPYAASQPSEFGCDGDYPHQGRFNGAAIPDLARHRKIPRIGMYPLF